MSELTDEQLEAIAKDHECAWPESIEDIATELIALRAERVKLVGALQWYAEPVLTYAITQDREPRSSIHADGGKRARAALAQPAESGATDDDDTRIDERGADVGYAGAKP